MRVEQLLSYSVKDIWCALTQHTELGEQGALVRFMLPGGLSATAGRITVYDAPKTLECSWDGDVLRWELEARDCMTCVVFTHTRDDQSDAARVASQWVACIDDLASAAMSK